MKKLILTEKPSVAKEIARVLKCTQNVGGAFIGNNYVITWALGHLVTLQTPEEMNKEWEKWQIETLPMLPTTFKTKVIPSTSKQFNIVKSWLKSNDISELIIATDAGREGELVARWIINKVGFQKPMKRLWISSMTDRAISEGFKHLEDAKKYERLYESAEARAIADWLVGLNVSRALTCKYNAQLSAGRVQTPTLAMIVEREEEINKFIPVDYFTISTKIKGLEFILQKNNQEIKCQTKEEALEIIETIKHEAKVIKIEKQEKTELPPLLYDLTTLQQDANRLYGFSAKQTLDIIQKLYEQHKYLTYPRTDAKYLTQDMYETIPERLQTITEEPYKEIAKTILKLPLNKSKRIFNDSLVSDHHAIILTEQKTNLFTLDANEKRIYDLVVKRMLSAFSKNYLFEHQIIELKIGDYVLKATGNIVKDYGWKKLYNKNEIEETEQTINFNFQLNETFTNINMIVNKKTTKPKDRYTEATLLYAMEHCGKFVDGSLKRVLEDVSGIGTPATRAEIIERIFSAGYVEKKGKIIYPTPKGIQLIKLVPNDLKSPSLTATWELKLLAMEKGQVKKHTFIEEMKENTQKLIYEVKNQEFKYIHDNATNKKCPNCGKPLLEVSNKFGKSLVCSDRICGFRKSIAKNTNILCPNCHRKLVEFISNDKTILKCSCGFKETKESFLKKLSENKNQMNKQKLQKYLKEQEKEIPANNPFEDFFKKNN